MEEKWNHKKGRRDLPKIRFSRFQSFCVLIFRIPQWLSVFRSLVSASRWIESHNNAAELTIHCKTDSGDFLATFSKKLAAQAI